MEWTDLHAHRAAPGCAALFPALGFATPWRRLQRLWLPPGGAVELASEASGSEHGLLLLDGTLVCATARAGAAGTSAELTAAPAWLVGRFGPTLDVRNCGSEPAVALHVEVAGGQENGGLCAALGSFDRRALAWRDAIHGGRGRLATRHVLPPDRFASAWTYLDHTVLGADSSLGLHYHDALEECFVVLQGRGYMTMAARTRAVGPGTVTLQRIGTPHGLYCPGPGELEFIRVAVALPDDRPTTVDLGDDLRDRRPPEEQAAASA